MTELLMGDGQSEFHGALLSMTTAPTDHFIKQEGSLSSPNQIHTYVYFAFFQVKAGSESVLLTMQTQKKQKFSGHEGQIRQLLSARPDI